MASDTDKRKRDMSIENTHKKDHRHKSSTSKKRNSKKSKRNSSESSSRSRSSGSSSSSSSSSGELSSSESSIDDRKSNRRSASSKKNDNHQSKDSVSKDEEKKTKPTTDRTAYATERQKNDLDNKKQYSTTERRNERTAYASERQKNDNDKFNDDDDDDNRVDRRKRDDYRRDDKQRRRDDDQNKERKDDFDRRRRRDDDQDKERRGEDDKRKRYDDDSDDYDDRRRRRRRDDHRDKERNRNDDERREDSRRKDDRRRRDDYLDEEKNRRDENRELRRNDNLDDKYRNLSITRKEPGEINDDDDNEEEMKNQQSKSKQASAKKPVAVERRRPIVNMLATKTGGAYIPPGRLKLMQAEINDKSSVEYQRIAWEALKKSINGLINKVNTSNVTIIVRELMKENLIRGRGLLIRSILTAQSFSTTFTNVYACLVAIINTKFPQIGELLLKRLVNQFKKAYKRNDKAQCLISTKFIAHLVNQQVAHEIVALEILTLLLENVTSDSVEVAVAFMKEVGSKLQKISPQGFMAIFESLRNIIQESQVDPRIQYMIEVLYGIRKTKFESYPAIISELDVINEDEQITHLVTLDDELNNEDNLNVFKLDPDYEENENKYKEIIKDILDEDSDSDDDSSGDGDDDDDDDDDDGEDDDENQASGGKMEIIDNTETNLINLRRIIYLTIQSSLGFEEAAHKILKLELKNTQLEIVANMILDCCTQQRTYIKFYGLLGQRFCELNLEIVKHFENIFETCYNTIQRLETIKLRNAAQFFAHLLFTDSISWTVLKCITLSEEDTCSASRVFIKILILELNQYMGTKKLIARFSDETLSESFKGLFPKDNPQNTRFAINYFTSINLGQLTDDLRKHLNIN